MRKILSFFTTITLFASTASNVVACSASGPDVATYLYTQDGKQNALGDNGNFNGSGGSIDGNWTYAGLVNSIIWPTLFLLNANKDSLQNGIGPRIDKTTVHNYSLSSQEQQLVNNPTKYGAGWKTFFQYYDSSKDTYFEQVNLNQQINDPTGVKTQPLALGVTNFTKYTNNTKYYNKETTGEYTINNLSDDYKNHLVTFANVAKVINDLNSQLKETKNTYQSYYLGTSKADLSTKHMNSQHILIPIKPLTFKVEFGYGSYHTWFYLTLKNLYARVDLTQYSVNINDNTTEYYQAYMLDDYDYYGPDFFTGNSNIKSETIAGVQNVYQSFSDPNIGAYAQLGSGKTDYNIPSQNQNNSKLNDLFKYFGYDQVKMLPNTPAPKPKKS